MIRVALRHVVCDDQPFVEFGPDRAAHQVRIGPDQRGHFGRTVKGPLVAHERLVGRLQDGQDGNDGYRRSHGKPDESGETA